jgi:hypothetical protein
VTEGDEVKVAVEGDAVKVAVEAGGAAGIAKTERGAMAAATKARSLNCMMVWS